MNFKQIQEICKQIVAFELGQVIYPIQYENTVVQMDIERMRSISEEELIKIDGDFCELLSDTNLYQSIKSQNYPQRFPNSTP
jgi:hypothetical protein